MTLVLVMTNKVLGALETEAVYSMDDGPYGFSQKYQEKTNEPSSSNVSSTVCVQICLICLFTVDS